jgi:hypothetical protein
MEEAAYVNVTVDKKDVAVDLRTSPGARVSGRVIVDGRSPSDGAPFPNVVVSAFARSQKYGPVYAHVPLAELRGGDRFQLSGLRGPMVLSASVAGGALVSFELRGEEVGGKPTEFIGTETIDDVLISLTTHVGRVEVTVVDRGTRRQPEALLVVIFREDRARWSPGYSLFDRLNPGLPPKTRFTRMAPGRYLVAAIPDPEVDFPIDQAVLDKLRPLATPLTLTADQTATVSVRVLR